MSDLEENIHDEPQEVLSENSDTTSASSVPSNPEQNQNTENQPNQNPNTSLLKKLLQKPGNLTSSCTLPKPLSITQQRNEYIGPHLSRIHTDLRQIDKQRKTNQKRHSLSQSFKGSLFTSDSFSSPPKGSSSFSKRREKKGATKDKQSSKGDNSTTVKDVHVIDDRENENAEENQHDYEKLNLDDDELIVQDTMLLDEMFHITNRSWMVSSRNTDMYEIEKRDAPVFKKMVYDEPQEYVVTPIDEEQGSVLTDSGIVQIAVSKSETDFEHTGTTRARFMSVGHESEKEDSPQLAIDTESLRRLSFNVAPTSAPTPRSVSFSPSVEKSTASITKRKRNLSGVDEFLRIQVEGYGKRLSIEEVKLLARQKEEENENSPFAIPNHSKDLFPNPSTATPRKYGSHPKSKSSVASFDEQQEELNMTIGRRRNKSLIHQFKTHSVRDYEITKIKPISIDEEFPVGIYLEDEDKSRLISVHNEFNQHKGKKTEEALYHIQELHKKENKEIDLSEVEYASLPRIENQVLKDFTPVFSPYNPDDKLFHFITRFTGLSFPCDMIEPLFCRVALYDTKHHKKISEDFSFHLNHRKRHVMDQLNPDLKSFMKSVNDHMIYDDPTCLFTLKECHEEIYLVIVIDKILQGENDKYWSTYRDGVKSEIAKDKIQKAIQNMGLVRQPFLWGYTKLFDYKEVQVSETDELDVVPEFLETQRNSQNIEPQNLSKTENGEFKLRSGVRSINDLYRIPNVSASAPLDFIQCIKEEPKNKYTNEKYLLTDSKYVKMVVDNARPEQLQEYHLNFESNINQKDEQFRKQYLQNYSKKWLDSNLYRFEAALYRYFPVVESLPVFVPLYPNLNVTNQLYIYPESADFSGTKYKSILIKVSLRLSDTKVARQCERVKDFFTHNSYKSFGLTSVMYHQSKPQFFDELRIQLPFHMPPKANLLFEFFHVKTTTRTKHFTSKNTFKFSNVSKNQVLGNNALYEMIGNAILSKIGMSYIPLYYSQNFSFISNGYHSLKVYENLDDGYVTDESKRIKLLPKIQVNINTRLASSCYTQDKYASRFLYLCNRIMRATERQNISFGKSSTSSNENSSVISAPKTLKARSRSKSLRNVESNSNMYSEELNKVVELSSPSMKNGLKSMKVTDLKDSNTIELIQHFPAILNILFKLFKRMQSITNAREDVDKTSDENVLFAVKTAESLEGQLFETLILFLENTSLVINQYGRSNRIITQYIQNFYRNFDHSSKPSFTYILRVWSKFLKEKQRMNTSNFTPVENIANKILYNGKLTDTFKRRSLAKFNMKDSTVFKILQDGDLEEESMYDGEISNTSLLATMSSIGSAANWRHSTSVKNEPLNAFNSLQFAWMFFDLSLKSIYLYLEYDSKKKEKFTVSDISKHLESSLKELFTYLVPNIFYGVNSREKNEILSNYARETNIEVALFLRDLIPILGIEYVYSEVISKYYFEDVEKAEKNFFESPEDLIEETENHTEKGQEEEDNTEKKESDSDSRKPQPKDMDSLILIQLEFLYEIVRYPNFIYLAQSDLKLRECLDTYIHVLSRCICSNQSDIVELAVEQMNSLLCDLDKDSRFESIQGDISTLFLPVIKELLMNEKSVIERLFANRKSLLDFLVIVIHILYNANEEEVHSFFEFNGFPAVKTFCEIISTLVIYLRFYDNPQLQCAITPIYLSLFKNIIIDSYMKQHAQPFVQEIRKKNYEMDVEEKNQEESSDEELDAEDKEDQENEKKEVLEIMDKATNTFVNILMSTHVMKIYHLENIVESIFQDFLKPFIDECGPLFRMKEPEKKMIGKKAIMKEYNSSWNMLLASIILHCNFPTLETTHSYVANCLSAVLDVYLKDKKAYPEIQLEPPEKQNNPSITEEDEIQWRQEADNIIYGATLRKLVEHLVVCKNKFMDTFFLTYLLFTNPLETLEHVFVAVEKANIIDEKEEDILMLKRMFQMWFKKYYEDLDSRFIAKFVNFYDKQISTKLYQIQQHKRMRSKGSIADDSDEISSSHKNTKSGEVFDSMTEQATERFKQMNLSPSQNSMLSEATELEQTHNLSLDVKQPLRRSMEISTGSNNQNNKSLNSNRIKGNTKLSSAMMQRDALISTVTKKLLEFSSRRVVVNTKKRLSDPILGGVSPEIANDPNSNHPFNLIDWNPREIAKQMTLIDSFIFKEISDDKQLFNREYIKENSDRFNTVSSWVLTTILKEENIKKRCEIIKRFLDVCSYLREFKNYNGFFSIVAGLGNGSIFKLSKTWKLIPDYRTRYEEYAKFMEHPFNEYRRELATVLPPLVPYLGSYLSQLVLLNENPSNLPAQDGVRRVKMINFSKFMNYEKIINDLKSRQNKHYEFQPVPYLQSKLMNSEIYENLLTEDEAYKMKDKYEKS